MNNQTSRQAQSKNFAHQKISTPNSIYYSENDDATENTVSHFNKTQ